jgi:transposase
MFYTGIDLHKKKSYLTTVDESGTILKRQNIHNRHINFQNYFASMTGIHKATVETTGSWYWLADLMQTLNIDLVLAHAKFVKAIAYAKVKTDKVDSHTLAQLLRMDFIPKAHQINPDKRELRDLMRTRLRLVQKHTSTLNSMSRILEKFNLDNPHQLSQYYQQAFEYFRQQADLIEFQIKDLKRLINPLLVPNDNIQRLFWIPGIGIVNAYTIFLETANIRRFPTENHFFSYCRLVPGANNSANKQLHKSGNKDGNKYLKIVFTDAAVHAIHYFPVIKKFYQSKLRKKNKMVARNIVAKEIARIVYHVWSQQVPFNHKFKGVQLSKMKSNQWPRLASPYA